MGALQAQLIDELGYDPNDGRAQLSALDLRVEGGDVPVGSVVAARRGAEPVAVARLGSGRLVVVADRCPHDGGWISDGFVEGERLVCARHGWQFEPHDTADRGVNGPALPTVAPTVCGKQGLCALIRHSARLPMANRAEQALGR